MVFLISYLSRLKTGFTLLLLQSVVASFSFSFIWLFFHQLGYGLEWLIFLSLLYTSLSIIMVPLVQRFPLRRYLLFSFIILSLMSLLLAFNIPYALFLYAFFSAILIVTFWIPLNFLFFRTSTTQTNAVDSSFYYVAPSLVVMVLPTLGAFVIHTLGYRWLYGISAVLYLFPLWYVWKKVPAACEIAPFQESYHTFKGLRSITLCEGALHFFTGTVIPIFTLLYFTQELQIGVFTTYLGLLGVVVGLFLSHHSDKHQQRKKFIYLLFGLLALCIAALMFVKVAWQWIVGIGVYTLLTTISAPLRLAVSLDSKKNDIGFWKMRELWLNIGRVITLGSSWIFFTVKLYWPVFVMYALVALAYPFLVRKKLQGVK